MFSCSRNKRIIIADMIVASDAKEWRHVGGDEDKNLRIHNLGTSISVGRYTEPTDDWSLKPLNKNKKASNYC